MGYINTNDRRLIESAALGDDAVRAALVAEPRVTVERLLGRILPDGVEVVVHEEPSFPVYYLAVPPLGTVAEIPEPLTRRHIFENCLLTAANQDPGGELRELAKTKPDCCFKVITSNVPEGGVDSQCELYVDDDTTVHVIIPKPSETLSEELPDDLLDFVSGGAGSPCNSQSQSVAVCTAAATCA
ncbi:MAG: hypothetical protein HQL41_16550 [Alphaproteobacteria bacterium]|nr:hypothetical protein [Alphaproteobacteria bacterium]